MFFKSSGHVHAGEGSILGDANAGFPSEEDGQDWHRASVAQNPAVDKELAGWPHATILGITFQTASWQAGGLVGGISPLSWV